MHVHCTTHPIWLCPPFFQVDALRPGLLGDSRQQYAATYCGRRLVRSTARGAAEMTHLDNSGLRRPGELHALLRRVVMLRRLKSQVLGELPPMRRQVRAPAVARAVGETGFWGG